VQPSLLQAKRVNRSVVNASHACAALAGKSYVSGSVALLSDVGYHQTAQLCCHHEMSLFVRREIARQGFDLCDESDLHGFVHWYDCSNDARTYMEMQNEIAGVIASHCPWLGRLSNCPEKGQNCGNFPDCPVEFPEFSLSGGSAQLNEEGYTKVAQRCCRFEMEQFVRRVIDQQFFFVCDEGGLVGLLHWYDCVNDDQTYERLTQEIAFAQSGAPCPWLGKKGSDCPPRGPNCKSADGPEPDGPAAHRRRTSCR
jgi:hypothetical protein